MKHTHTTIRQHVATYAKLALAWVATLFGAKRAPGRETASYDSPRKLRRAERAVTRRKYARALFKLRVGEAPENSVRQGPGRIRSRRIARAVARRKAFASAARRAIDALRAEQRKTSNTKVHFEVVR